MRVGGVVIVVTVTGGVGGRRDGRGNGRGSKSSGDGVTVGGVVIE